MKCATGNKEKFRRLGSLLGSAVRGYVKIESRVCEFLKGKGIAPVICRVLLWSIRLCCLAIFAYVSFWVGIAALVGWALIQGARLEQPVDDDENTDGWRQGHAGFGYYCGEYRVDHSRFDDRG
ncbi:DUF3742 family protein [Pseudomonas cichorii]|nr:DUF3742 family protein [Pseudomonas cichorii]MBX8524497.1 DUF3742 family protein [Pseudomonas cichorii]